MNLFFENLKQNYKTEHIPHYIQNQLVYEFEGDKGNVSTLNIIKAIQSSKKNVPQFESVTAEMQVQWFLSIKDLIVKNQNSIIQFESYLQGVPETKISKGSVTPMLQKIDEIVILLQDKKYQDPQAKTTVGSITPATYSFFEIGWRILYSLFHKTPIIIKPAQKTAATSLIWIEILKAIQIPESLVQIIQGQGEVVGQFLIEHPGISHISFSGSVKTVKSISKNLNILEKKYQIYSSGKNSLVILPGFAFQEMISEIAKLLVLSVDGSPLAISKIFITEAIEKEFKAQLRQALEKLNVENFCKLTTDRLTIFKTVTNSLVSEGANKLFENDSFVLLADLTNCSEWHQEADNLPIVNITTVKYQHEIHKWINNTPFGHSIFIYGDSEKAEKFAKKAEVRNIFINPLEINNGFYFGLKQSGFGDLGFELPNPFFSYSKRVLSK